VTPEQRTSSPVPLMNEYRTFRDVLVPGLKAKRLELALSQETLAELAGVGRTTISRGERGQAIRLMNVRKLAKALKCKPADLQRPPS
jgi:DNA-binding XRE family transcriptional regulator